MFVKSYKILLATSILLSGIGAYANSATETEQSSLKYSNWYIGTSFGEGDYSKFTIGENIDIKFQFIRWTHFMIWRVHCGI